MVWETTNIMTKVSYHLQSLSLQGTEINLYNKKLVLSC